MDRISLSDESRDHADAIGALLLPWLLKNMRHFPAIRSLTVSHLGPDVSPPVMAVLSLLPHSGVFDLFVSLSRTPVPIGLDTVLSSGLLRYFSVYFMKMTTIAEGRLVDDVMQLVSQTPAHKSPIRFSVWLGTDRIENLQPHIAGVVNALTDAGATHALRELVFRSSYSLPLHEIDVAADLWRVTLIPSLTSLDIHFDFVFAHPHIDVLKECLRLRTQSGLPLCD